MNEMESRILEIIKASPGLGLFEISTAIYGEDRERWKRNAMPKLACRSAVSHKLNSLTRHRWLRTENPDGRRKLYYYRDD